MTFFIRCVYLLMDSFFSGCSPSGKLVQIEYALAAVAAGASTVGIKATNGVVLATEKKHKSILYDDQSVYKVEMITKHTGMVYSGEQSHSSNSTSTLPYLLFSEYCE